MYDLVLRGGRVVDPSSGLDGVQDIAVRGRVIARIAPSIPAAEASRIIEVAGKIVAPGLIDLHAHVFEGVTRNGVHPDLGGVYAGVTTIVDAGSSGAATFAAFPRHVIPHCHTEIIPVPAHLPDRPGHQPGHHRREQHRPGGHPADRRPAQGPDLWDQGPHGLAGPRDHGHGHAPAGPAGRPRERHQADGPHRGHGEALRPQGHPRAAASPREGRHPHPLLHRESRRRAGRQRQARAGGARGGRSRGVVRHRARADELQLRRRAPHHRAGPAPALHQHGSHRPRPPPDRPQHDGDDDPLPGSRLYAARRW